MGDDLYMYNVVGLDGWYRRQDEGCVRDTGPLVLHLYSAIWSPLLEFIG